MECVFYHRDPNKDQLKAVASAREYVKLAVPDFSPPCFFQKKPGKVFKDNFGHHVLRPATIVQGTDLHIDRIFSTLLLWQK